MRKNMLQLLIFLPRPNGRFILQYACHSVAGAIFPLPPPPAYDLLYLVQGALSQFPVSSNLRALAANHDYLTAV